jgi:hypothetical protein
MNHTQDSFQKYERLRSTKRKTHETDNVHGRKGRKKDCYSEMRGLKRNWSEE